jgi:glycosyltransferase involved in cell wall biosynthesis
VFDDQHSQGNLKMKVLHIISGLDVGGAELMLKRLVESSLRNVECEHKVISLTQIGAVGRQIQEFNIEVQALGMKSSWDTPRVLWELVRLIRNIHPDIVQTWMYHSDFLGGLAARLAGNSSVVWGIRTTYVNSGGNKTTALLRQLCAWLSRVLPNTIVCAADASRRAHIKIGYDATRMVVVPNGFDLTRLVATPKERDLMRLQCGLEENHVVIGFMGRFHTDKDQENFVRAASLVMHSHVNARFLMVGRGLDTKNEQLTQWIGMTGDAGRFVLLGERSDVPICLSTMDVFCLSSRTEGFPNVVAEAMSMGLPCVVTDVGYAAMLVADSGVVVPKEDPDALASGIIKLLAMPYETRRMLGKKAKVRIHSEFSMENCTARYNAVYKDVIAGDIN